MNEHHKQNNDFQHQFKIQTIASHMFKWRRILMGTRTPSLGKG
jgi:hypothetical protein